MNQTELHTEDKTYRIQVDGFTDEVLRLLAVSENVYMSDDIKNKEYTTKSNLFICQNGDMHEKEKECKMLYSNYIFIKYLYNEIIELQKILQNFKSSKDKYSNINFISLNLELSNKNLKPLKDNWGDFKNAFFYNKNISNDILKSFNFNGVILSRATSKVIKKLKNNFEGSGEFIDKIRIKINLKSDLQIEFEEKLLSCINKYLKVILY